MKKYTETTNSTGDLVVIQENEDGTIWSFMADPSNTQYQIYLRWLENPEAEQSTPMVTDADKS
jgi:hypothetical protein